MKYKFDQSGIKGIEAADQGKLANFGEGSIKYVPKEESKGKFDKEKRQRDEVDRLAFERELADDADDAGYCGPDNIMEFKEITAGMTTAEKQSERNKRAAIRNFFLSSKVDQDKVKE